MFYHYTYTIAGNLRTINFKKLKGEKSLQGIDHIGIAVNSVENALPFYTKLLGFKLMKIETVTSQKVRVAIIDAVNCKIELLEPTNDESPISMFLEKRGEGIHHIALKTNDIQHSIEYFKLEDLQMIDHRARLGAGEALIAFLHPKSAHGVLYELYEHKEE